MFKPIIRTVMVALTASLTFAQPADANKLLDWLACNTDITDEVRPSIRDSVSLYVNIGWLDGELYNDSRNFKVTSATFKVTGTYADGRQFTRKFEQARNLLPGYSERLLIKLGVEDVQDVEWSILELRGCKSSR